MGPTASFSDKFPSCAGKYPQSIILYTLGHKWLHRQQKKAVAFCLAQCRGCLILSTNLLQCQPWSALNVASYNLISLDSFHVYQPVSSWRVGTVLRSVHSFSIAIVTNCHKFSGLKWHKIIVLPFWRSEAQNQSHWAKGEMSTGLGCFLEVPGENPFPCLFQLLDTTCTLRLMASFFSIFKANNIGLRPFYVAISLVLLFCFPFPLISTLVITLGPPE